MIPMMEKLMLFDITDALVILPRWSDHWDTLLSGALAPSSLQVALRLVRPA